MFTNDIDVLLAVKQFRNAAVEDGWSIEATYSNEDIDSAASLVKDGFNMKIISRIWNLPKYKYEAGIYIWGPDRLTIMVPKIYNFEDIKTGLRHCNSCNATDVDTMRYSFAGRCCKKCLPETQRKYEYAGWEN